MLTSRKLYIYARDWSAYVGSHAILIALFTFLITYFEQYMPMSAAFIVPRVIMAHLVYLTFAHFQRVLTYPPGPPPLAIFGNSPFINIVTPEDTFLEYRELYGPVFTLHLSQPTIILADFESIQEGLTAQGAHTAGRSSNESFVLFTNDRENGDGVILAMRETWKEMRSEISRFLGTLYGPRMDDLIMHHTRSLEVEMKKVADSQSLVDLRDPLAGAIANVIQQITIGKTFLFQDAEFQDQLRDINSVVKEIMTAEVFLVNVYPWLRYLPEGILRKWTTYKRSGFRLQQWFRTILEDHFENRHQEDFMSHMIERQESGKAIFKDISIILACGDLWTGGMETTVTTLRWGIIYLLKHPEVQQKCHEEIVKVFGDREPEMRKMLETPYVRAVLSEIQRLANVLPWAIPHKTLDRCSIGGFSIPNDTEIIPGLGAVMNDPNVFKNPKEFKPERFLENGKYKVIEQFRPFGVGPRICLGERIARTELYLIFCSLMQNFKFYLNKNDPIPTTERIIGGITAPPKTYPVRVEYLGIREIKE